MSESEVSRELRKVLEHHGHYAVKIHQTGYNTAGIPDLLCCVRGVMIGIETKLVYSGRLKYTEHQIHHLNKIRNAGGIGIGVAYHNKQWALDEKLTGETDHLVWCSLASLVEIVRSLPIHQN